ncbi:hypothetical protein BMS3Abin16_01114 [archaeon BMS3Abin16]|nr:hypothetical protein BMS3Abin16_01114 [archaeon BMS3Abin16]
MMETGLGMGGFGMGLGLLFWIFVFAAFYYIVTEKNKTVRSDSTLDVLKQRYASGEINRDEYQRVKKEI